jgi:hypothetical protein
MSRHLRLIAVCAGLLASAGCPGPTSPGGPSPGGSPGAASATSLQISGNLALTSIGETSQFTATATFSDGSSRDVTGEVSWGVTPTRAGNISPTGLLTAQRLGRFLVFVNYSRFLTSAQVTVTRPGTMAVLGYMYHPPYVAIDGAQVRNLQSGQVDDTPDGYFLMGNLTDLRMSASKNLFEPVEFIANPDLQTFALEPLNVGVPMQKIMRVEVGSPPTTDVLWPDDVEYQVTGETSCQPCRLVRLVSQTSGSMRIHITWTDVPSTLNLWINGRMFPPTATREIVAEVPITRGNELIVYVGKIRGAVGNPVTFTLAASPGG